MSFRFGTNQLHAWVSKNYARQQKSNLSLDVLPELLLLLILPSFSPEHGSLAGLVDRNKMNRTLSSTQLEEQKNDSVYHRDQPHSVGVWWVRSNTLRTHPGLGLDRMRMRTRLATWDNDILINYSIVCFRHLLFPKFYQDLARRFVLPQKDDSEAERHKGSASEKKTMPTSLMQTLHAF